LRRPARVEPTGTSPAQSAETRLYGKPADPWAQGESENLTNRGCSERESWRSPGRKGGGGRAGGSCRLSVVSCQLSVVGCRLSVVGCRLSVVGCQLSVVSCQLSVVSCQLSVVSCQFSVVGKPHGSSLQPPASSLQPWEVRGTAEKCNFRTRDWGYDIQSPTRVRSPVFGNGGRFLMFRVRSLAKERRAPRHSRTNTPALKKPIPAP
jgi:tyrosine kinase 3/solute carrier family 25 phosphate transporter 23/24/25/41